MCNCLSRLLFIELMDKQIMNKIELEAFAREAAKSIKTEKDLNNFSQNVNQNHC